MLLAFHSLSYLVIYLSEHWLPLSVFLMRPFLFLSLFPMSSSKSNGNNNNNYESPDDVKNVKDVAAAAAEAAAAATVTSPVKSTDLVVTTSAGGLSVQPLLTSMMEAQQQNNPLNLPFHPSLFSLWKKRTDILPPEVRHQLEMMQKMEEIREMNAGHKQVITASANNVTKPQPASKKKSHSTESPLGSSSLAHGERSKSAEDPHQQPQQQQQQSIQVTEYENLIQGDHWPVDCIKCGLRLNNLEHFNAHMNDHWSEDKCCPVCGLLINSKRFNFKQHLKIHTGEKPFVCKVCNRSFRQKAHMVKHITTHRNGETAAAAAAELATC